jgi:hypothetical protein
MAEIAILRVPRIRTRWRLAPSAQQMAVSLWLTVRLALFY